MQNTVTRRWARLLAAPLCGAVLSFAAPPPHVTSAFTARNLMHGSTGYDVDELQSRLAYLGYYHGKVDGTFGWDTYWAVRDFQYAFGMKVTGNVNMATKTRLTKATSTWHYRGPAGSAHSAPTGGPTSLGHSTPTGRSTASRHSSPSTGPATTGGTSASASTAATPALNSLSGPMHVRGTSITLSHTDLNLMAHIIYAEARNQPFSGQVAIGAVIINRLKSSKFPNTVPGIVYHPGAFQCVSNGTVNLTPNATAWRAVADAVKGWDPVGPALYYFNPATSTSSWIWSRTKVTQIGQQIFST